MGLLKNKSNIFVNKKVVFFGTGEVSKIIAASVPFKIAYYVDNNSKKWNMAFGESEIASPNTLLEEDKEKLQIYIASTYYDDIAKQLESMGFIKGIHFWNGCEVFSDILGEALSKKSSHVVELLKKNVLLKNIHKGKRCFIIANGPSIAKQDLLMLKDDIKIVVSSFYKHPQLNELHPEYWVVADPQFWTHPESTLFPLLRALKEKNIKTKFFMPSNGADLLMSETVNSPNIDPHIFHFDLCKTSIEDIDLSKDIPPWAQNVIVTALLVAFHLGCENIYLLGCDHDWWGYTKEEYEEANIKIAHFYQQPQDSQTKITFLTFEQLLKTIVVQRNQYERLKEYGEKKNQHVYNATEGGLLDIFPRVKYDSLF